MNKKQFFDLLAQIEAANLAEVSNEQLSEWSDALCFLNDDAYVGKMTDEEIGAWKKQFERVNDELSSRGIIKLSLADMIKKSPETVESWFSLLPLSELMEMEKDLATISDCEFKSSLQAVLHNSKIIRICYLSSVCLGMEVAN